MLKSAEQFLIWGFAFLFVLTFLAFTIDSCLKEDKILDLKSELELYRLYYPAGIPDLPDKSLWEPLIISDDIPEGVVVENNTTSSLF